MKLYVSSYNGVLDDYKEQVELASPVDADKLIMWQDCSGSHASLAKACKTFFPKPIYTMQHGRRATRDYDAPLHKPFNSDVFLAWGKWDYDNMTRMGFKTEIAGCPLNTWIKPPVPHKESVVMFVPVSTGKEEPDNILIYNELLKLKATKVQEGIRRHYEQLRANWPRTVTRHSLADNFTLISKVLPWQQYDQYTEGIIKGYQDSRLNNEKVFSLLRNANVVVGLDEGTTELFAVAHDIPVIVVDGFEYRWKEGTTKVINTPGITHVRLEDLNAAVEEALAYPSRLHDERMQLAENEMSIHSIKDPIARLHEIIGSR
jgi:hypothetical protein